MKLSKEEKRIISYRTLITSYKEIEKEIKYLIVIFNMVISNSLDNDIDMHNEISNYRITPRCFLEDIVRHRGEMEFELNKLEEKLDEMEEKLDEMENR